MLDVHQSAVPWPWVPRRKAQRHWRGIPPTRPRRGARPPEATTCYGTVTTPFHRTGASCTMTSKPSFTIRSNFRSRKSLAAQGRA